MRIPTQISDRGANLNRINTINIVNINTINNACLHHKYEQVICCCLHHASALQAGGYFHKINQHSARSNTP